MYINKYVFSVFLFYFILFYSSCFCCSVIEYLFRIIYCNEKFVLSLFIYVDDNGYNVVLFLSFLSNFTIDIFFLFFSSLVIQQNILLYMKKKNVIQDNLILLEIRSYFIHLFIDNNNIFRKFVSCYSNEIHDSDEKQSNYESLKLVLCLL